ncbi:alpha-2-macroglobulin-like protein 1 [Bufo gargarizans]|uniref:alpha-2-macroglobulin-like protein 1 n=1 Tax=Bufo gargarizans TaxID=30331 RepID=UPI001CF5E907|nr:alpha-2-macroglobulin-like protein 1 [Bufo gargarizans]
MKGALQLKMTLKREQKSILVTEDTVNTPTYFHCYSFQLPTVVDEEEVCFFHVSAHGDNINVNQTKKILLMKGTHLTFIQTNKPIYKPGEAVNFRIVTLDTNFNSKNDKHNSHEFTTVSRGERTQSVAQQSPALGEKKT